MRRGVAHSPIYPLGRRIEDRYTHVILHLAELVYTYSNRRSFLYSFQRTVTLHTTLHTTSYQHSIMATPPKSPFGGLPSSPRPDRQMLYPINTNLRCDSATPSSTSEKASPEVFVDTRKRNRDSLIFVNATIPLSPASSVDSRELPYDGLAPRKRNAFARLFCCLGRQERARRRAMRSLEYEKVGEKCHWTEY